MRGQIFAKDQLSSSSLSKVHNKFSFDTSYVRLGYTVTNLANYCATPLFRRPQGSWGCLEKQNHPLSRNLVDWCAKIGPKTKKV